MTARLESTDWTPEDSDCARHTAFRMMDRWCMREILCYARIMTARDAYDADLMLVLEEVRARSRTLRPGEYPYAMVHTLMRAELRETGTLDWHQSIPGNLIDLGSHP